MLCHEMIKAFFKENTTKEKGINVKICMKVDTQKYLLESPNRNPLMKVLCRSKKSIFK